MTQIAPGADISSAIGASADPQTLADIVGALSQVPLNTGRNGGTSIAAVDASAGPAIAPPGTNVFLLTGSTAPGQPLSVTTAPQTFVAIGTDGGSIGVTLSRSSVNDTVLAGAGADTITSNSGASGHPKPDTIWTGTGADTVNAGGASDVAGNGLSTINAGRFRTSADTISAGVSGTPGQGDVITLTRGNNTVYGARDANITAGLGHDTIIGAAGPETITGGGLSTIYAAAGNTVLTSGADTIIGGAGRATIDTEGGGATLQMGRANQRLNLSYGASDSVFGGGHVGTVIVNRSSAAITSESVPDANGFSHVAFADGASLSVSNVNVHFKDGTTTHFV